MTYDRELERAQALAVKAGRVIMEIYRNKAYEVLYKEDESPVTTADHLANEIIVEGLKASFPEYAILSEERHDDLERRSNRFCWLIDPLDGTKEFIKRNGEFSVNIALIRDKRPVLGVIYLPATSELYYAAENIGAYYIGNDKRQRIEVSHKTHDLTALRSRSRISQKLTDLYADSKEISNVIRMGSSMKGCRIAHGMAEIYYSLGMTMEWDTAAMEVIVEQAGGIFRQLDGSIMQYNRMDVKNRKGFYILNRIENELPDHQPEGSR